MALVKCPDCGKMVSERALACPECGCPAEFFIPNTELVREEIQEETEDDKENDKEEQRFEQTNEPEDVIQKEKQIILSKFTKVFDWPNLVQANTLVSNDLRNILRLPYPVSIVDIDNVNKYVMDVQEEHFEYPYVFVHSIFRFAMNYKKCPITTDEGNTYQKYYNFLEMPCEFSPAIEILTDNEEHLKQISDLIMEAYASPSTYSVPRFEGANEYLSFTCKIVKKEVPTHPINNNEHQLFRTCLLSIKNQWEINVKDEETSITNENRAKFRLVQLAEYYSLFFDPKRFKYESDITLYERLFQNVGGLKKAFGPSRTPEYDQLKYLICTGGQFDGDIVDKAFPYITVVYHNLPNDIFNRVNAEKIRQDVKEIVENYNRLCIKICDSLGITNDIGIEDQGRTRHSRSMQSNEGLNYIINALDASPQKSIIDITADYRKMVEEDIEECKIADEKFDEWWDEMQADRQERRAARRESGGGMLGSIVSNYVGNMGVRNELKKTNKLLGGDSSGRKQKPDLLGSAGCYKTQTGYCDMRCNLYHDCCRSYFNGGKG